MDFSNLSARELYSDSVINKIFDETDPVTREQMIIDLKERADEFGRKTRENVDRLVRAAERSEKEQKRQQERENKRSARSDDNYTDFGSKYPELRCGAWIADSSGIADPYARFDQKIVCSHPVLPVQIIKNVEEGTQKVKLAFNAGDGWQERIYQRSILADRAKVISLANDGISVDSNKSKDFVRYISTLLDLNFDTLPRRSATVKMGWKKNGFMPYNTDLEFDRDGRFDALFDSVHSAGSREKWLDFVLRLRQTNRLEPRAMMAASFASVLLKPCGLLPFWFNIWGTTGGGKTVCVLLAASIWAEPVIGQFITDFKDSAVSYEVRANCLNNLPFFIDDTAQVRRLLKDDFSAMIYKLASGKGRGRSNVRLGVDTEYTWNFTVVCSGETPLSNEKLQGGAVNRVLDFEVDEGSIFEDGQKAAILLSENYGFAGREFVEAVNDIGFDRLLQLQQQIFEEIKSPEIEDKQTRSLSAVLLADKIATDYIFKDGRYLTFNDLKRVLVDKKALSENERCLDYLYDSVNISINRFNPDYYNEYKGEMWGDFREVDGVSCVVIINTVFQKMCSDGGYSYKGFLAWAVKRGLVLAAGNGERTRSIRLKSTGVVRCICLRLREEEPEIDEKDELAI